MKAAQRLWEAWAGGTAALRKAKPGGATRLVYQTQPAVAPTRAAVKSSSPSSFLRTVVSSVFEGAIPKAGRSFKGHTSPARYKGAQGVRFAAAPFQRPTRFAPRSGAPTSFARQPVGLSLARNFSTGQSAFANVIHNAPFGIRALADAGVWDARMLRKVEAAQLKEAKGKGKAREDGGSRQKPLEQVIDTYFPRETTAESCSPAPEAAIRLVIPLHASAVATFAEQSASSHNILPRGVTKGDWRSLQEAQRVHDGRIRKVIEALDMEEASVHFLPGNLVAIDLAAPWTVSEVRQALGIWDGDKLWFDILDLQNMPSSTGSDISSLSNADLDAYEVDSYVDAEEAQWYEDAARDLVMPSMLLGADFTASHPDLGQWSSEGSPTPSVELRELNSFVAELDAMQRPAFVT